MALYLLIRDHKAHPGALEVGWRVNLEPGYHREGDVIFAYHSSVEHMLKWAQQSSRKWHEKIPLGIIDVRDTWIPEEKLFASVPILSKLSYHMLDSVSVEELGGMIASASPGDPDQGMWIARADRRYIQPGVLSRRTVYNAAFGAPAGVGSVRDRLQDKVIQELNQLDYWAGTLRVSEPKGSAEAKGEFDE